MSRSAKRITVGQKAAVHGLLLAGVGYVKACRVVDVHRHLMHAYVGRDWRRGKLPCAVRDMTPKEFSIYRRHVVTQGGDKAFARATR